MFIPFSLSKFNEFNNYIDISFVNKDKDNDIKLFLDFINQINKYFKNKKKYKKLQFRSSLKEQIDIFPERLRLNFNTKNNIMIFDEDKHNIDISYLKPKSYGKFLIQLSSIWIRNNEYGLIWNIVQVKLYTNLITKPTEYLFIEDDHINTINTNNTNNNETINDPIYKPYLFMLKIGLSYDVIRHKLIKDNLDPNIIDIITDKKSKFNTIKLPTQTNSLFNQINNGKVLKKTIIKKKSPIKNSDTNKLIPSKEDILLALNKLKHNNNKN
tara:strand:- start:62 stop:868 length:807 start_codon:yes stop_codon:yes gene_type:complete